MRVMEKQSLQRWVDLLEKVDPKDKNSRVAMHILRLAALPKRRRIVVNLNQLSRHAGRDENIVVPGKVLAIGSIDKPFAISTIDCSEAAVKKLKDAGCSVIGLEEMLKREKIRIIM